MSINASTPCCPTCHRPLPEDLPLQWDTGTRVLVTAKGHARFLATEARFVDALVRHMRRGPIESVQRLADLAYCNDINGGPESLNVVSIYLKRIRAKIEPLGWTITKNMGQPRIGFLLRPLEPAP